jgi:hypothetical protein
MQPYISMPIVDKQCHNRGLCKKIYYDGADSTLSKVDKFNLSFSNARKIPASRLGISGVKRTMVEAMAKVQRIRASRR